MAGFEELGREYLADLLGEVPNDLLPPTHPDGPRSMKQMRGPQVDAVIVDDVLPTGVCVLRRSCGSSCYCVRGFVAKLRHRFGPHWPAEPPMEVGPIRYAPEVEAEQRARRAAKGQGLTLTAGALQELGAWKVGIDDEIRRRYRAEQRSGLWLD